MNPEVEAYTHLELDEFAGALLYIGGLHGAMGHLLDVTRDGHELIEYLNHAPASLIDELISASLTVSEVAIARLKELQGALESAHEHMRERVAEEYAEGRKELLDDFANIINGNFGGSK